MLLNISNNTFHTLMSDPKLFLPLQWNGADFYQTLSEHFDYYQEQLRFWFPDPSTSPVDLGIVHSVCSRLLKAVNRELNGLPSKALRPLSDAMKDLMNNPLRIYQKTVFEIFEGCDPLSLFRTVRVDDIRPYQRSRVFHTPYHLRSKVSASRYSIAGFPSLYLGTSLQLCCEELHKNPYQDFMLASRFQLNRNLMDSSTQIEVIELGIKPQDFFEHEQDTISAQMSSMLQSSDLQQAYLLWYPLVAACSYTRVNKNEPFAAEYIVPQLLMQWVRLRSERKTGDGFHHLTGIRYFSCASRRASNMGYNYVFPTSGDRFPQAPEYCNILAHSFFMTKPVYIHEYDTIRDCEAALRADTNLGFVNEP